MIIERAQTGRLLTTISSLKKKKETIHTNSQKTKIYQQFAFSGTPIFHHSSFFFFTRLLFFLLRVQDFSLRFEFLGSCFSYDQIDYALIFKAGDFQAWSCFKILLPSIFRVGKRKMEIQELEVFQMHFALVSKLGISCLVKSQQGFTVSVYSNKHTLCVGRVQLYKNGIA